MALDIHSRDNIRVSHNMNKKDNILSVRLNQEERAELEYIKRIFGTNKQYGEDSRTIKLCITFTKNVIHNLFGEKLAHCFKKDNNTQNPTITDRMTQKD